ncbi:putative polyketide synthase protein [Diplogelasinospora grovesii]|uniref:Polyketide synthase protein n=1 Tax=Diplogelasinospora grovesii TaxID=303347 RepID=A0AAN6ND23_9PEZI|nr:putative polyketide synthase protein [Diplogelasinospora grovesii]
MAKSDTSSFDPVAVVGISCRLPGGANSVDKLWELLEQGAETWSPVPADRFNETAFYHPNADDPNGTNNHRGGHFIDGDVRDFDHSFFRMSPQQAVAMDPQQRILLEMSHEALENAGWPSETIAGSSTAVYAAVFTTDFDRNLYKDPLDLPTYYVTGTAQAILANRISHFFDLRGPSMTLDTGCSGGFVALHQACQSLRCGESDAAIVAAANLTLSPDHHVGMSNLHMIGSTGRSYPFDSRGEGYGRGEGCVVLVLKRLQDALRDRDSIRTVIRGTALNQDGYTAAGITHPNGAAQAALIRAAYAQANLRPQDVAYVEAHGTGTVAGDREELAALAEVFTGQQDRRLPLYVGSIKGSIGHTENTSGLASLVKAALILDREIIPPVAGFSKSSPKPGLPLDRVRIPTELVPWPHAEGVTPRVSINSFGFGGSNAHAILERGPRASHRPSTRVSPRLFVLSADNRASLLAMIEAHRGWVDWRPGTPLEDVSYTLCHRRSALSWRFSCVAEDRNSLLDGLDQGLRTPPTKPVPPETNVVFIFTGQGAQWLGMGRELLLESAPSPVFRNSIRASRDILHELGATWDLETELLHDESTTPSLLNTAELAQPATTAVQIALVALLRAWGVRPHAVVGHSSGEIAAAYTAGHISHRTAIAVAFHRGFMAAISKTRGLPRGAMMSVGLGEHEAAPYTEGLARGVACIACINSPSSVTISGDADAVDEIAARLAVKDDGIFRRRLLVDTAYHSHHMRAVADDYGNRLGVLGSEKNPDVDGNEVDFVSSVSGTRKSCGFGSEYWTTNLVSPVRFCDAIQSLTASMPRRHTFFIEIGPHGALAGPVRQCLADSKLPTLEFDCHSVLQRKVGPITSALNLAGHLFDRGIKLNFDAVSALTPGYSTATALPDLPAYVWDHSTKHWHESRLSREYRMRRDPYHDLLGVRIADSTAIEPRWRHMISPSTLPWLADHVIDGLAIFPGSGYLCMAIEAISQLCRERNPQQPLETVALRDISFLRALVILDSPQRTEMQLSLRPQAGTPLNFAFHITAFSDGEWHEHCTGLVEGVLAAEKEEVAVEEGWRTPSRPLSSIEGGTALTADDLYRELAVAGNTYGPTFAGIRSMTLTEDASRATATVEIPNVATIMPAQHQQPHVIHPTTLDIVLHTTLPMVGRRLGSGSVMPVHIDELLLSTTAAMSRMPGSELHASTTVTSSHFRTAHADVSVSTATSDVPVLLVSGIEMRSLAAHAKPALDEAQDVKSGICYELDLRADIDHIRTEDLPSNPRLTDLISHICFKSAKLSVVEFGVGRGSLALDFFRTADIHGSTLASYDFVDVTRQFFDEVREQVPEHSVSCHILSPDGDLVAEGSKLHPSNVILVSELAFLDHASALVKPGGMVVFVLNDTNPSSLNDALQHIPPVLDVQLTFHDVDRGSLVVLARPSNARVTELPRNVQILTHSASQSTPSWVIALKGKLSARGVDVSLETLEAGTGSATDVWNSPVLVIDDLPQPIISDPRCYSAAFALLKQPAHIIWLSPDDPLPMHQITGLARTAHAENDKLRLTTIHAAPNVLEHADGPKHARLLEMLAGCLVRAAAQDNEPHHEREYRVREDGTVLVPRLRRSEQLNRAVSADAVHRPDVESRRFIDNSRSLILSNTPGTSTSSGDTGTPAFVEGEEMSATTLADDEIELEARATVLSESGLATPLSEYAGVVKRVGAGVRAFSPGDLAVALGAVTGANHPRVTVAHAGRLPPGMPPTTAVGLLLSTMAACHALYGLARLQPTATVLIHGALSAIGRATLAVARSIGARITATAADPVEACLLVDQCGLSAQDVLVTRSSIYKRLPREVFAGGLDAVIQASESAVPVDIFPYIRPFGSVIIMGPSASLSPQAAKLPLNVAVYSLDIMGLLQARPEMIASLVAQATAALEDVPTDGLDLCVRDIAQTSEGLRLIEMGISTKVVLQVNPDSVVPVVQSPRPRVDGWDTEDASYVVAGGLGDLGRRLLFLMARRGAMHLITLSRRVPDPDDYRSLQSQLDGIRPGCRIIQSAAILQVRAHFHIKVDGTLALERAFTSPNLEFFLMLSSVANIIGTSGQANYNAGNAVQDAIAQARRGKSCHFVSLNIGWIEDAVATADHEARLSNLRRAGLRAIRPDELSRYLDYALGAATSKARLTQAVIGFDAASLSNATTHNGTVRSAMFSHVRNSPKLTPAESPSSPSSGAVSFAQILASGSPDVVVGFIANAVAGQLARLISVDTTRIDTNHGSMLALGLDSLVAIELRNWIMREFDAPIQSSELMIDQSIRALAEKVAARSRVALSSSSAEDSDDNSDVGQEQARSDNYTPSQSLETPTSSVSPSTGTNDLSAEFKLPAVPLPTLEDTLQVFRESHRAIDSPEDQDATSEAVRAFLEGPGPLLQRRLEDAGPGAVVDAYERQVYLERREPLQDYSTFFVGHPIDAPVHSQATRAAVLTIAGIEFARQISAGNLAPDTLHGVSVTTEARYWLFYTARRPGTGVDRMDRFTPNQTVAVLRRGHVFQISFPDQDTPLHLPAVYAAYDNILRISDEPKPTVCTLTADDRESWVTFRNELELDPENTAALQAIDSAAFVVCLDNESPNTAGDRHMQFLLNSRHRDLVNRWLDKPVQFAVTANGVSAGIYEHAKIDGMDVRELHKHLTRALFAHSSSNKLEPSTSSPAIAAYPIREYVWRPSPSTIQRIRHIQLQCKSAYGLIDHRYVDADVLGLSSLRDQYRAPPNATAHLTVLLALYLVDGGVRPAWETASLATFARGRVDWVQTVTSAARAFVEAAAGAEDGNDDAKKALRSLFDTAVIAHSLSISAAARGRGYVHHMYALLGVLAPEERGDNLPALFRSRAWEATRRGGQGQDFKIGFMPDADDGDASSWDEGGFLMDGENGIYVHCGVREKYTRFVVSARPEYAGAVCDALRRAATTISSILTTPEGNF